MPFAFGVSKLASMLSVACKTYFYREAPACPFMTMQPSVNINKTLVASLIILEGRMQDKCGACSYHGKPQIWNKGEETL